MQSPKKSSISPLPRSGNYSYSLSNKNVPRKKHVSIQTDHKSALSLEEQLKLKTTLKDEFVFDENMKETYSVALEHINRVHTCMNNHLYEKYGECGDTEPDANNFFKLPNIPNYSTVYLMLVDKTKPPKLSDSATAKDNKVDCTTQKNLTKSSGIIAEYVPEQNIIGFNENVQQAPKRNHDKTVLTLPIQYEISDTEDEFTLSQEPFHATHTKENINYVQQVVIYSKTNSFSEEERIVESNFEKDNFSESSDKECGTYIDVIRNAEEEEEEEDEENSQKIKDALSYATKQDESLQTGLNMIGPDKNKLEDRAIMDVIKQRVQEEFMTYLNAANLNNLNNEKKVRLAKSNFYGVNIQPQINLFEYAQKKMERRNNHFERETKSAESDRPHKVYFNNFLSGKNSVNIKPSSPEKVTNLFRKISKENFSYDDVKYRRQPELSNETPSDNDSVILDDEEFEKMNKCHFKEQKKMDELKATKNKQDHIYEQSHPLKLNGKDMTKLNEKVLSAIGLFTERGDIRPGIIDILEKEKRAKAKDSRNKQFRARRQWDLQVHLQPKKDLHSWTSVSTEKSFVTLSSDIKSDFETVKNISRQMENLKR